MRERKILPSPICPVLAAPLMASTTCWACALSTAISMRTVAWAAMAILLVQPESLLHASFQLSFAAVVALIAVSIAGGFLGAWLGGKAFEATGNYDWMWWADIGLCLFAAAINLPIREAHPRLATSAA